MAHFSSLIRFFQLLIFSSNTLFLILYSTNLQGMLVEKQNPACITNTESAKNEVCTTNQTRSVNQEQLFFAIAHNNKAILDTFISENIDYNAFIDNNGRTPFHYAACFGNIYAMELMIKRLVGKESVDKDGNTALHVAGENGHHEIVSCLLENGCNPFLKNKDGITSLHSAAINGDKNAIIAFLIHYNLKLQSLAQSTKKHERTEAYTAQCTHIMNEWFSLRAECDAKGFTALHYAAQFGHIQTLQKLLTEPVSVNICVEDASHDSQQLSTKLKAAKKKIYSSNKQFLSQAQTSLQTLLTPAFALHVLKQTQAQQTRAKLLNMTSAGDGATAFHLAAAHNQVATLMLLKECGADAFAVNSTGKNALYYAVENNAINSTSYLLSLSAQKYITPDKTGTTPLSHALLHSTHAIKQLFLERSLYKAYDSEGESELHKAAQAENLAYMKALVEAGVSVEHKNMRHQTPLHSAVLAGKNQSIALLVVDLKADVNAKDIHDRTPLHYAAMHNYGAIIEVLKNLHAKMDEKDTDGFTPFHRAVKQGNLEAAQRLIALCAQTSITLPRGRNAYHTAAQEGQYEMFKFVAIKIPYKNDEHGNSALHKAKNDNIVNYLIQEYKKIGWTIDVQNNKGQTPLHKAAKNGRITVIQTLLAAGAQINARDNDGKTALHYAAQYNHAQAIGVLLSNNAEINARTKTYITPLHLAAQYENTDALLELVNHKADIEARDRENRTPLHYAAMSRAQETVQALLALGSNCLARDRRGRSCLHSAILGFEKVNNQGKTESNKHNNTTSGKTTIIDVLKIIVKALYDQGKKEELTCADRLGLTPLFAAVSVGNRDIIDYLLSIGCNIKQRNNANDTIVHIAARYNQCEILQWLLSLQQLDKHKRKVKNTFNINATNDNGWTALHHAAQKGHCNSIELLLQARAFIDIRSILGQRPLQIARKYGQTAAEILLMQYGAEELSFKEKLEEILCP